MSTEKITEKTPFYSLGEEIANSVTHGIGAALSVAGLTLLVALAVIYGDVWRVVGFSIYGGSLILLYLASTLYHSLQHPRAKRIFRTFDHASIYILIAGTYTPYLLISVRGVLGWSVLAVIWTMALIGVIWKIFFLGRFDLVATLAYVGMGWMALVIFKQAAAHIPPLGLALLVVGGVVYTAGVVFYVWRKLPYNHAIWHLFVLGGSIFHFFSVITLLPTSVQPIG